MEIQNLSSVANPNGHIVDARVIHHITIHIKPTRIPANIPKDIQDSIFGLYHNVEDIFLERGRRKNAM
jgi:hypothetical protein